jgi:uncharacterized protein
MQVITYSLRDRQEQSDRYYVDVAAFVEQVTAEGQARFGPLIQAFQSFMEQAGRERPSTSPEYIYELLTLGVLWRVYICAALNLPAAPRRMLSRLAGLRERARWLKPGVDALRGVLGTLFLSSDRRVPTDAASLTVEHLDTLLGWLSATGEYTEQVKRLARWRDFLAGQPPEQAAHHLAAVIAFADWFDGSSQATLGKYTPNVERFLDQTRASYRWREDAVFCARKRIEYHLNMVGAEILNRAYRQAFLSARRKAVLLPPCMRYQPEDQCQARSTAFGAQCAHCTPGCRVHQVTLLGDKYGFAVFMLPDDLAVFSSESGPAAGNGDLGILGVSCVLTNAPGGWKTHALGVPAQGVLLDYCGCHYHWHKEGFPTDLNVWQLLRVVGVKPE